MTLSAELLAPIAGENPAGTDLRYDPVQDKIKEARREDLDVPAGDWETTRKLADWPLVIKLATEALAKRTKDLQIAVWLTEGLLRRDGIGGLRQGLELLHALLEQYWDNLYPEVEDDGDMEMRAAPLSWLGLKLDIAVKMAPLTASGYDYLAYVESQSIPTEGEAEAEYEDSKREARAAAIAAGKVTPEAFGEAFAATPKEWYRQLVADVDGALAALGNLNELGNERFGDDSPSYRALEVAVDEVGRSARVLFARKLEAEPDPKPEGGGTAEMVIADVTAVGTGQPAASAPAAASSSSGAITANPASLDDASARIAGAARYLRSQAPTNPAPYMLLRGYRWGEIRAGSGSLDPRMLAAPPTEVRVRLKTLLLDGQWSALLEAAEDVMAMPYGRGWLDLQRIALTACDALGSDYEAVAAGIRGLLRSLLEDLPDLPSLTLMDDSPTANAETLRWLEAEGFLAEGDGAAAAPAPGRHTAPARDREPRDRALELARSGAPNRGIEFLMQEAGRAKSSRTRFLRRTEATGIMVDYGHHAVALPILRELAAQIDQFQLEQWESGDLLAEPLGLLYRCLDDDPSAREELYLRICRLDPIHAMTLGGDPEALEQSEQSGEE